MTWQVVLSFAWICSPSEVIELHRSEHASSGPIFVAYSTASWNHFGKISGGNWDMLGYVAIASLQNLGSCHHLLRGNFENI